MCTVCVVRPVCGGEPFVLRLSLTIGCQVRVRFCLHEQYRDLHVSLGGGPEQPCASVFLAKMLPPKFPQSAPKARPRPAAPRPKKRAQARVFSAVAPRTVGALSVQIACIFSIC